MSSESAQSAHPTAEQNLATEENEGDASQKGNEINNKESVNGDSSEEEQEKEKSSNSATHSVQPQKEQYEGPANQPVNWRPPPQPLNWPRQQPRPPFQQHSYPFRQPPPPQQDHSERKTVQFASPPAQRGPNPGVIRRLSPWAILKAKLPPEELRARGPEYPILRMQSPDTMEINGPQRSLGGGTNGMGSRPPSATRGPPPQLGRQPSMDSHQSGMSSPDPRSMVRSPYLQRSDSNLRSPLPDQRNISQRVSTPINRPPSRSSTLRSSIDDDDDVIMTSQSRPQSASGQRPLSSPQSSLGLRLPQQMSGKTSPSPNSEVPPSQSRPPSRGTPPQSPLLTGMSPARSPLPERQSNLSSLMEESNIHGKEESSKIDSSYKSDIGRADSFMSQDKTKEENRKDIKPEIPLHDTSINDSSKSEKEQNDSTANENFQHGGRRTELFGSEVTDHFKSEASKIEVSSTKPSDTSKVDVNSEPKLTKQDSVDKKLISSKDEKIKPSESESSKLDSRRSSNSSTPLPTGSRPASRADTVSKESVKQKAESEKQSLERLQTSDLSQGKESSGNLINETDTSENKQTTSKKTSLIVDDPIQSSPKRPTVLKSSSPNFKAEKSSSSSVSEGGATQDGKRPKETVVNGDHESPKKSPSKAAVPKKLATSQSPMKSPNKASSPKTPDTPSTAEKKKLPMNKIQVGAAPSPNLKTVKSKIGSLENAKYKPGGGHVKIESRKLNFNVQPKIEAKNETYAPKGGDKKIQSVKLQWNAKPKVGSLENASHKPGGGDKKIESVKLDFKDKAKPKVGSKDNIKHVAGGGTVKNSTGSQEGNPSDIEDQKLEIKAQSKVGSLDNVKHKPGGGDKKIYVDKNYLKQMAGSASDISATPNQGKKDSRRNSSSRSKSTEPKFSTREISIDGFSTPEPTKPTDQNFNQLSEKNTQQGKVKKDLNVTKSSEQLLQSDVTADSSTKHNNSIENVTIEKNEEIKDDSKKDANGNGKLEMKQQVNNSVANNSDSAEIIDKDIKLNEENVQTFKENNTNIIKTENEISSLKESSKTDTEIKESEISNSVNNQKDLTTKSDELPLSSSENSISKEFVMVGNDIEDETSKPSLPNI